MYVYNTHNKNINSLFRHRVDELDNIRHEKMFYLIFKFKTLYYS